MPPMSLYKLVEMNQSHIKGQDLYLNNERDRIRFMIISFVDIKVLQQLTFFLLLVSGKK